MCKDHLCLVFELVFKVFIFKIYLKLSVSLLDVLKQNHYRGFSCSVIREICVQSLRTLGLLRDSRIIHCDLKPENILLVQYFLKYFYRIISLEKVHRKLR